MKQIVCEIAAGARLASLADSFHLPTTAAIKLWRFTAGESIYHCPESQLFERLIDDAARGAYENGDCVSVAGWYCGNAVTRSSTADCLDQIQRGVQVLNSTMHLINHLYQ